MCNDHFNVCTFKSLTKSKQKIIRETKRYIDSYSTLHCLFLELESSSTLSNLDVYNILNRKSISTNRSVVFMIFFDCNRLKPIQIYKTQISKQFN